MRSIIIPLRKAKIIIPLKIRSEDNNSAENKSEDNNSAENKSDEQNPLKMICQR